MGSLEEVSMPQNGINHQGIAALADAFASNKNLRILNLNDNTFTEKGANAMAEVMLLSEILHDIYYIWYKKYMYRNTCTSKKVEMLPVGKCD